MIDLNFIRRNPDEIQALCWRRGCNVDVNRLVQADEGLRETLFELENLRRQRKALKGPEHRERAIEIRSKIQALETRVSDLEAERNDLWARLPNLLPEDTPDGKDDSENVPIQHWGELPKFDFDPKPHDRIGADLGILDFGRGAEVAGSGFYYWHGDGARLAWAIFSLALDYLIQRDFIPMFTPVVARQRTLFGTGYLPFGEQEIYRLEGEDLCLIGTSEQTLVGYHVDEILPGDSFPRLYTAFTPCFRTEAGSYGREARGAYRVHQFHKVEQIVFCKPEESEEWHLRCQRNIEEFMQLLEIPYRVVRVCLGDLGAPAYKKYDTEGWFAGFSGYRETHSNTNLLDFQTRRLNIRFKVEKHMVYPHTISATMITDRAALAILENNQQANGSVLIPRALRPLMGGQERIE